MGRNESRNGRRASAPCRVTGLAGSAEDARMRARIQGMAALVFLAFTAQGHGQDLIWRQAAARSLARAPAKKHSTAVSPTHRKPVAGSGPISATSAREFGAT